MTKTNEAIDSKLDSDIQKIISAFGMEECNWLPEPTDCPAMIFRRGFLGFFQDVGDFDLFVDKKLGPGWLNCYKWANGYRSVYMNLRLKAILTCCEGDIDLTVDETEENFNKRIASAEEFYARY